MTTRYRYFVTRILPYLPVSVGLITILINLASIKGGNSNNTSLSQASIDSLELLALSDYLDKTTEIGLYTNHLQKSGTLISNNKIPLNYLSEIKSIKISCNIDSVKINNAYQQIIKDTTVLNNYGNLFNYKTSQFDLLERIYSVLWVADIIKLSDTKKIRPTDISPNLDGIESYMRNGIIKTELRFHNDFMEGSSIFKFDYIEEKVYE